LNSAFHHKAIDDSEKHDKSRISQFQALSPPPVRLFPIRSLSPLSSTSDEYKKTKGAANKIARSGFVYQ
jgi:hypothetical protein